MSCAGDSYYLYEPHDCKEPDAAVKDQVLRGRLVSLTTDWGEKLWCGGLM